MRALILASLVFGGVPAAAQEIYCEGAAGNDHGEVIVGYDLSKDGAIKSQSISWMPARDTYASRESTFVRAPRLVLYYREKPDGDLVGPSGANVAYTQFEVPGTNRRLSRSQITIQATAMPSGKQVSWKASDAAKGEPKLAELVRENDPARLKLQLLDPNKEQMVVAEFDLTRKGDIRKLLPEAKERGEREIANYKRLVARGMKLDNCPPL